MRDRSDRSPSPAPRRGSAIRIRADLQQRGVDAGYAGLVAERLAVIADDLSRVEYAAILQGVAAAWATHHEDEGEPRLADVEELKRLMEGFAGELHKLEEGLRILSAYLTRMGSRAAQKAAPTLH